LEGAPQQEKLKRRLRALARRPLDNRRVRKGPLREDLVVRR